MGDCVSFGQFRLFPAQRRLEKQGVPVKLGARSLDILVALVERAGSLVTKNDLLARVWQDVTVDESALRVHMASLRKALGDGEDGARYLANVSGRGYAFVAEIVSAGESGAFQARADIETERTAEKTSIHETNLPQNLTPIIGRAAELAALQDLVSHHRLVTLAGMGGIGKTRLAIELALLMAPRFDGGVWLVDLAPLADPALVPGAAAAVLGASLTNPEKAVETIAAAVTKPTLLIFDNCEHLVGATASLIDALLPLAPGLSVIATSQEPLRVAPEHIYTVNPLAVPLAGSWQAHAFGAVELFVTRGRSAVRGFQLDDANAAGVIEICRRLEGIPLALEMAAARLSMFGVEGLRAHLNEPLRLLKFGAHMPDVRHRTLRDMVEWSHGLLDETERQVFRRLAIFAGSFSLEAAVAVAGAGQGDAWETMDALGRLVERSLVIVEPGELPRYRLLETLRLFAFEKLAESGEGDSNAEYHARFFADFLEASFDSAEVLSEAKWGPRYLPESENIRVAFGWALASTSRRSIALDMAGPVLRILNRSNFYEARRLSELAEALIDDDTPPRTAARIFHISSRLWNTSDLARSLSLNRRAADLYRQIGDGALDDLLRLQSETLRHMGRLSEAKAVLVEAHGLYAKNGRKKTLCLVSGSLGNLALQMGEYIEAKRFYETGIATAREIGEPAFETGHVMNLAELEFALGNIDRAVELGREALSSSSRVNLANFTEMAHRNLVSYLLRQGNVAEARLHATEASSLSRMLGGLALRLALMQWGLIAALECRFTEGALLMGFVDAGYAQNGEDKEGTEQHLYDRLRGLLESTLPADEFASLAAEGAKWSDDEAFTFAHSRLISTLNSSAASDVAA
jgi:predicted ATPase/DNA-binding winged helix-turn-helix (wHTH) protein